MAAERDSQLGITFVYSNFYELYRQGKLDALKETQKKEDPTKGIVLKTSSSTPLSTPAISSIEKTHFQKWMRNEASPAKKDLAKELLGLREARKRLGFLTAEVDELLKKV